MRSVGVTSNSEITQKPNSMGRSLHKLLKRLRMTCGGWMPWCWWHSQKVSKGIEQFDINPDSKVYGPTWGPHGADRTQLGHMWAPWTLLSGKFWLISLTNIRLKTLCSEIGIAFLRLDVCRSILIRHRKFFIIKMFGSQQHLFSLISSDILLQMAIHPCL